MQNKNKNKNKIKISNYQLMITTHGFVFGTAPLLISSSVASFAGQDAWISAIISTVVGLLFIWINTSLGKLYPDKTIVEIIVLLLGKWLGTIVALFFIIEAFITSAQITWYIGDFITTIYMPEVSPYPINILFVFVIVVAMFYGLEAMYRATEIFFIVLFPLFIASMLMLLPDIHVNNLLPIFEKGVLPSIKGTIPLISLTALPTIYINMVYPKNIEDIKKAKKSIFFGYLLGMFTAFLGILMCILVLGSSITANIRFPLFTITQVINLGSVFSRLEALFITVWFTTNFISTFFYFYAGTIGLTQLLKLDNYRKLVLPLALIMAVYSGFIYKNTPYEICWDTYTWPPVIFVLGFVLPVVLLCVSAIKRRLKKSKSLQSK